MPRTHPFVAALIPRTRLDRKPAPASMDTAETRRTTDARSGQMPSTRKSAELLSRPKAIGKSRRHSGNAEASNVFVPRPQDRTTLRQWHPTLWQLDCSRHRGKTRNTRSACVPRPCTACDCKNAAFKQAEVELHDHLGHSYPSQEDHHRVTVVDQAQDLLALLRLGTTIKVAGCLMLIALLMMLHKRATCGK